MEQRNTKTKGSKMKHLIFILLLPLGACTVQDTKENLVGVHNFTVRRASDMEVGAWNTGVRTIKTAGKVLRVLVDGTEQMMNDTFGASDE